MVRLKLFSSGGVLLSDVLPTFEHLGAKVADERPYEITPTDRGPAWIYDFGLQADPENIERSATSSTTRSSGCGAASSRTTASTASCSARP